MTVASQLKQTIAALKGVTSNIEIYALHHPDPQVKALFQGCHQDLSAILSDLNQRLKQVEFEEPQFKGF